jgi:hypothetical protein
LKHEQPSSVSNQAVYSGFSRETDAGDWTMTVRTILSALAVLAATTSIGFAQSLPNYGPNAPATGDSFGKPPSATRSPGVTRSQRSAYAYQRYQRYHRHRHKRVQQPSD